MSFDTHRDRLGQDRLEDLFTDFKPALTTPEAETEANRCINCYDAPCITACPTGINIPQFIARIGAGNPGGAARTILSSNILGQSCAQSCPTEVLCEGACVYNNLDKKPILIGKLQRFAVEYAYENKLTFFEPGKPTGKKVALIGAGPASLACAHELRRQGHQAVVYEKTALPGGLNTTGIAPYKMKAQVSLREIDEVERMGVRFEYRRELGRNLDLKELVNDNDAVFLGLGLGADTILDISGKDLPGVMGAVEFISQLKTAPARKEWRALGSALVIGGGNTALDACRELKKLGVPRVAVSYRRGESDMSGYSHEFKWARQEGVEFLFHTLPVSIEKSSEKPARLSVTLKEALAPSQKAKIEADLVLFATGQGKLESLLGGFPALKFEKGRLLTHESTGRTDHPKIFAGGDLANGGKEVVNAVAEGKRAAIAMNEVFKNG